MLFILEIIKKLHLRNNIMDAIQFIHDLIRQLSDGAIDMDDIQKQVHSAIPEPSVLE